MNILLLGAGGNAGINFTKCLHMGGHKVIGMDINTYYLDSCNADIKESMPSNEVKIAHIKGLIDRYKIDMVHAQPDPEVKWLLENAKEIGKVFPHSLEMWEKFSNKLYCQKIWNMLTPIEAHSYLECCMDPILFSRMRLLGGGKVWIRAVSGAGSKAALPISSFEQAENWVSYWEECRGMNESDFMLSEFLPGREFAVQMFFYHGKMVHCQARERLIYFFGALMPSGQTSTPAVAKTISERRVYDFAEAAILLIDPEPHGIYCMDMKENSRGELVGTEVNYGRFFTTSDFFATMGVNTPVEYIKSIEKDYVPSVMINYLSPNYYWIRGLDKEPKLIKYTT